MIYFLLQFRERHVKSPYYPDHQGRSLRRCVPSYYYYHHAVEVCF